MRTALPALLFHLCTSPSLTGCGYQEDAPPSLTGIRYQSPAYMAGFGGGRAGMTGVVDFRDPDGDLILLHVRWQDCGTGPVHALDSLQEDLARVTSGSISFIIHISTDCPAGHYEVKVHASDGQGNVSNTLRAPYEIYLP